MMDRYPLTRDLVLIGGGHTHALILRMWGMNPLPGARVTVIDPNPTVAYSGMLPGFVAGHYDRDDLSIDLMRLARFAGARVILGRAEAIDLATRTVTVPGRPPVAFDVASIDIGISSDMPDLPGFTAHATPAKPLTPFAKAWSTFRDAPGGDVAVIGGGVAGAELAMAMAHALGPRGKVRLIDKDRALAALGPGTRQRALTELHRLGIDIVEGTAVASVSDHAVTLTDGREIPAAFTCGAAGARPQDWLRTTGLDLHDGFVTVDRYLRTSDTQIFASGDCAHMTATPRPKAGVFAVRQAPVLFHNLRAALSGSSLKPYTPQRDYLKLVSLGGKSALAEKWGRAAAGPWLWRLKDRIDRRFMDRLNDLPPMQAQKPPRPAAKGLREALGDAPMCAGCGAKVGRGVIGTALEPLTPTRADVDRLPGDDAAVIRIGDQRQVITTDHLRAVTEDPVLMTRIAAIHALGDIWAMGAEPQAALVTLILPRMSPDLQARTMAEIMATATEVLTDAGAAIAGGHTSQGDELTIGFTLTGLCHGAPVTLSGARAGDALILTKPIGSGVILAAEMRGKARGAHVSAAHTAMIRPQGTAARILQDAHAMTDVTGFGLAGHLAGMCSASTLRASITLADVPLMDGAEELAVQGIRSTLWTDNRGASGPVFGASGPRGDLMFDPQTCGGLLAAVASDTAAALLADLLAAGYPAAIIGHLEAGDPAVTFR
jgi:selenide,water dikinase